MVLINKNRLIPRKAIVAILTVFCFSILLFTAISISAIDGHGDEKRSSQKTKGAIYGTLAGQVIDAETNKPISDAQMTLKYHELVRYGKTDDNGWYSFSNVPICFCLKNISASKSSYESQYKMVGVSEKTYVNFSIEPTIEGDDSKYGLITGMVIDEDSNEPIAKAHMELKYHDATRHEFTDSEGKYTFDKVPMCFCLKNVSASITSYENQFKLVAVQKVTYVNFSMEPVEEDPDDDHDHEPEEPDDKKKHKGVVTGIVIDAFTSDPIEEAFILLKYHGIIRNNFTDAEGKYSFTDVPECNCSKEISAEKDGYEIQHIQIGVYEVTHVNFSLKPAKEPDQPKEPDEPDKPDEPHEPHEPEPKDDDSKDKKPDSQKGMAGVITGIVTDSDTNKPMANVIMTLKYHGLIRTQKTNSNGEYEFDKVPICYCLKNITAFKTGYKTRSKLVPIDENTKVDFKLVQNQKGSINLPGENPMEIHDNITSKGKNEDTNQKSINYKLGLIGVLIFSSTFIIICIWMHFSKPKYRY